MVSGWQDTQESGRNKQNCNWNECNLNDYLKDVGEMFPRNLALQCKFTAARKEASVPSQWEQPSAR